MSEIAESRKLFQDLIAPDVKSVVTELAGLRTNVGQQFKSARESTDQQLQALRESMDQQFKAIRESLDGRFDAVDGLEQARYATVIAKIEAIRIEFASSEAIHAGRYEAIQNRLDSMDAALAARQQEILKALDIDKRLERVEARQAAGSAA